MNSLTHTHGAQRGQSLINVLIHYENFFFPLSNFNTFINPPERINQLKYISFYLCRSELAVVAVKFLNLV